MTWHVYLLRCADGSLYAGITTDLERRVAEHNAGKTGAKYTRARRPVSLVWSASATDRAAASRAEHSLRRLSRKEKESLIVAMDGAGMSVVEVEPAALNTALSD